MRVSIWQQFSSNHSAGFTLVGQFESAAWAEQVADEMRHMLKEIGDWWEQFDCWEERTQIEERLRRKGQLTPPEEAYQKQYGVEWSKNLHTGRLCPLDWVGSHSPEDVHVYDKLVIIQPRGDSWIGPQPLDTIMQELGGQVAAQCEIYDHYLAVTVTCDAPDETVAEAMVSEVEAHEGSRGYIIRTIPGLYSTLFEVSREGKKITYKDYQLRASAEQWVGKKTGELNLQEQFAALLDYLKQQGCSNVQYHVHEVQWR